MKFQEVPSVADILNNGSGTNHFEFSQTYDEVVDKIAFIIHSSGTTGTVHLKRLIRMDYRANTFSRHA